MNRAEQRAAWRAHYRASAVDDAGFRAAQLGEGRGTPEPSQVTVSIGELVLHGFRRADRYAIGEAVQNELQALIAGQGVPDRFRVPAHTPHVATPPITVRQTAPPAAIGAAVAGAVYRGGGS
jgi:hypothetical protein